MKRHWIEAPIRPALTAAALWAALALSSLSPAMAADAVFPVGSRLGLVPIAGLQPATTFQGFEDPQTSTFLRLVSLPSEAFSEIEKTMTNEALKKQGITVEKREPITLPSGNGIMVTVHQETQTERIRKWLMIAPAGDLTALVSLETGPKPPESYTDAAIRTMLASLVTRASVPVEEQLSLVPFHIGDTAGFRLVRVVPGVAVQFTDGPKDTLDATDQAQLVIAGNAGGPSDVRDRGQFARDAMTTLPPFKDVNITGSEPMRIGGQPGYETRATGKDAQTGAEIEIIQWLRFGTGAYLRMLGFSPKEKWAESFPRFRAIRDGLEPR